MKLLAAAAAVMVGTAAQAGAAVAPVPPILFASDRSPGLMTPQRFSVNLAGSARRRLPVVPENVSPDGRLVTVIDNADGKPRIEIVRRTTGARIGVIAGFPEPPGLVPFVTHVVWAPNSKRIAITVLRPCSSGYVRGCNRYDVWAAGIGSKHPTRLSMGRARVWSPDSKRLAIVVYYGPWSRDSIFVGPPVKHGLHPLVRGVYPSWSPHGDAIAYRAPAGVAVVDIRTRKQRLVEVGETDAPPVWSPSGRELAFVIAQRLHNGGTLYVADLAKRRLRVLADAPTSDGSPQFPAWSPNGRMLAFVIPRQHDEAAPGRPSSSFDRQVVVVPKTGGRLRQLTHEPPSALFSAVAWNRAGTRVSYAYTVYWDDQELFAIDASGGEPKQLTDNFVDELTPTWAPDGEHVVFQRSNSHVTVPPVAVPALIVRSVATGDERLLRTLPGTELAYPAWSPSGGVVAAVISRQLTLISDADGSTLRTFETFYVGPFRPAWSPDGREIAVSGGRSSEILVVDLASGSVTEITSTDAAMRPAWSPDGRWIAFVSRRDERSPTALWVVHPDGSTPTQLTGLHDFEGAPAWSPDSTRIAYSAKPDYNRSEIHVVDADGTNDHVLSAAFGVTDGLDWRR